MNSSYAGPILLVGAGVLLLLNNLSLNLSFWRIVADYWPLTLIGLGAAQLIQALQQRRSFTGALVLLLIGVAFQAHELYPEFSVGRLLRTYWPVALIAAGASQLYQMRGTRRAS